MNSHDIRINTARVTPAVLGIADIARGIVHTHTMRWTAVNIAGTEPHFAIGRTRIIGRQAHA